MYHQRDIVKVKIPSTGVEGVHPFLIISNERSNSHEKTERRYTGVMLTHSKNRDKFTLEITKEMVEGKWEEDWSQIRLHIIGTFREQDISRDQTAYVGKVKLIHFKQIIQQIKDYVFTPDS